MPALRERMEDLPILVQEILKPLAKEMGRSFPKISPSAIKKLSSYPWPGNVRELRNVLERALLTLTRDEIHSGSPIESEAGPSIAAKGGSLPAEEWEIQPLDQVVTTYVAAAVRPREETSARLRASSRSVRPLSTPD